MLRELLQKIAIRPKMEKLNVAKESDALRVRELCKGLPVDFYGYDIWSERKMTFRGAPGVTVKVYGEPWAINELLKRCDEGKVVPQKIYYMHG